jgi:putative acetyltransferase
MIPQKALIIAREAPRFFSQIDAVEQAAFGRPQEARLVAALREMGSITLSLIALLDEGVTGHVLFSPVTLEPEITKVRGAGLGPLAVSPAYQRSGIGGQLILAGLEELRRDGFDLVVVLGDPAYYARFGFEPAVHYGARCTFPAPVEDFMLLELSPGVLQGWQGLVRYPPEFDKV